MIIIRDYIKILQYRHAGFSQRDLEKMKVVSRNTCKRIYEAADNIHLSWPLDPELTNRELQQLLFPNGITECSEKRFYSLPDYELIHKKLAEKGVTLMELWKKYQKEAADNGEKPYQYTQFKYYYKRWSEKHNAVMRIQRKPGDIMQVDWAGKTLSYYDPSYGGDRKAYFFVASLPYSGMIYTCACNDMKSSAWLQCHVKAYEYFGGVTRLLIPDNLKTGVTSHVKSDVVLNKGYEELADYYGTAIVPARVRAPRDKASAERSVRIITESIIVELQDMTFFSLDEINDKVKELLSEVNKRPFSDRDGCRRSLFEEEEKQYLSKLPVAPFEASVWKSVKVPRDYCVSDGINRYSVPYTLIGDTVDLRIAPTTLYVYHNGAAVATHERVLSKCRDPFINPEHMTPRHLAYLQKYNAEDLMKWGESVGGCIKEMIAAFLSSGKVPEQGIPKCVSLRSLVERNSVEEVEKAYRMAVEAKEEPTLNTLRKYVKLNKSLFDRAKKYDSPENPLGFRRGSDYYKG